MNRALILFITLFSLRAFCLEGSTYFIRQSFLVPAGATCSQDLDQVSRILFGASDEFRLQAPYAFVRCVTGDERPLQIEVLFEPNVEAERQALEDHVRVIEGSSWRGESFEVQYVNTIFWNLYGSATDSKNAVLAGFEKPRVAKSFDEVLRFKNAFKTVSTAKLADFLTALSQQMSAKDFAFWKSGPLGQAKQVDFSIYLYFLTDLDRAEKSGLSYQFSRLCAVNSCF